MKPVVLLLMTSVGLLSMLRAFAQEGGVNELVYMTENYPPANYVENGELKGASVEMLKLLWKTLGYPEQPIQVLPWARGYLLAQTEKNHVLFTMSRTPERETLFKWVGPIFVARHVLVGLANRNLRLTSLDEAKQYKIGTLRDDIAEVTLLHAGFDRRRVESVADLTQNIQKLLNGRVDLICQSDDAIRQLTEIYHYDPQQFEIYFVVNEMKNYYAFHHDTPDALIQRFQAAFDSLKEAHQAILTKYHMNL